MVIEIRPRMKQQKHNKAFFVDERYHGKYVAIRSFHDHRVVASGTTVGRAVSAARKKGVANPVVLFAQDQNVTCLY